MLLYKPWRRSINRKRERCRGSQQLQDDKELGTLPGVKGSSPDFEVSQGYKGASITADERQKQFGFH